MHSNRFTLAAFLTLILAAPAWCQQDSASLIGILRSQASTFEKAKACQQLAVVGDENAVAALAALLDDPQLSNYARYALQAMPQPAAAAALRDALGRLQGDRLLGIINSLGRRRDAAAVSVLAPLLSHKELAISAAAAIALGRIGSEQSAASLLSALQTADAERRAAAADGCLLCADSLRKQGRSEFTLKLCQAVRGADVPDNLRLAATLQVILAGGKDGKALLAESLDSDDEAEFRLALQAIRRLKGGAADLLVSRFDSLPASRQVLAVLALGDVGGPETLETLRTAAGSDNVELRVQALGALAKRGGAKAVPILLDAALVPDPDVASAASHALAELNTGEVDAAIVRLLDEADAGRLPLMIRLAGQRRLASAAARLLTLASSDDKAVQQAAVEALGTTVSQDDLPRLIKLLAAAESQELKQAAKEAVRVAAARLPDRDACAARLAEALRDAAPDVRDFLFDQLAAVGGTAALEAVVAAARSDDPAMQDAATRALGTWMSADVAPKLLALAREQRSSKYRVRLLRGYIRVARQLNVSHDESLEICRNALQLADRDAERQLVLDVLARMATPEAKALIHKVSEPDDETGFVPLFDGKTLAGWEGNLDMFRVRDAAIVGGSLTEPVPRNEFLCTEKQYSDFELRLQFKLLGEKPNAGVQIRSQRIPNHHEVSGYQADLGDGWWGCLYDESRRRKVLAGPAPADRDRPVNRNDWNDYRIRCQGKRIQLWINGVQTVDYTEDDPRIEQKGIIGVQVHAGAPMQAWYRNIRIKPL